MARNHSLKVLGEGRESRFNHQGEHSRVKLVNDGAPLVFDLLADQSLIWVGVRLNFAEEILGFH